MLWRLAVSTKINLLSKDTINMKAIIVSDLHIGSRYFLCHEFKNFIKNIPSDYELILNGDIIDNPKTTLPQLHQRIFDLIVRLSYRNRVVWVQGNHDNGFVPNEIGKIEIRPVYTINNSLLIAHGHDFDQIMPMSKIFIEAFKQMHKFRILFGARPIHVADYAKRWKWLYKVLLSNVMKNAVINAKEIGYDTVACGHTHYPEEHIIEGIRYINTGAWTESPAYYMLVNDKNIILKSIDDISAPEMAEQLNDKAIQAA